MYERITHEVLKNLRGQDDCLMLSKKMGYTYNQYFKFEAGYKKFKLNDFLSLIKILPQIDELYLFDKILELNLNELNQKKILDAFCSAWGTPSLYVIEHELNMSHSKWWRLKNGKSVMDFSDFLMLVGVMTGRLIPFSQYLLPQNIIDKIFHAKSDEQQAFYFLQKYPDSSLILTAVYHEEYITASSSDKMKVLQKITGIKQEKFLYLIEQMLQKKIICYSGERLISCSFKTELKTLEIETGKSLFNYIVNEINDELKASEEGFWGKGVKCQYKVAVVSSEGREKIVDELKKAYAKISDIIVNEPERGRSELILLEQALIFKQ